jgi:nucleoid DNA-binding protein
LPLNFEFGLMNKQELISAIASAANLSTVEAACALDATTDAITHALAII